MLKETLYTEVVMPTSDELEKNKKKNKTYIYCLEQHPGYLFAVFFLCVCVLVMNKPVETYCMMPLPHNR